MNYFSKQSVITYFDAKQQPAYYVDPDEEVIIETHDCYGGQINSTHVLRPDIDLSLMDLATGPIYVNSVKSGDILCVEILDIELGDFGIMVTSPGLGPLGDKITKPSTKILPIQHGNIYFNEHLTIPIKPMIGVIGVAPKEDKLHCAIPGVHGGNLDTTDITINNKVYLPVFQDGALISFGDLHASMGDGEMNGTGVETAGKVTVKFKRIIKGNISMPVVETNEHYMFTASGKTFEEAILTGMEEAVHRLQTNLKISFEDGYRLLSAACDLKISQIVNELITVRIAVPKQFLPHLFTT